MPEPLHFPSEAALKLEPYLPPSFTLDGQDIGTHDRPFVTLTFATSLDSAISLSPGTPTPLSGPQSKAMTHYLRSRHDAILVGVGTALADDPSLNCRLGVDLDSNRPRQPRPVVVDPRARWALTDESKVLRLARRGEGLAPFVLCAVGPPAEQRSLLERHGGKYVLVEPADPEAAAGGGGGGGGDGPAFAWEAVLDAIRRENLRSVMIEGGGKVINSLLEAPGSALVDSVVVTIAPTWLGRGGVVVSPERTTEGLGNHAPAVRLTDVAWCPMGEDVVLCGRILR